MAERTRSVVYMLVMIFFAGWIYPIPAHWIYDEGGWLSSISATPLLANGFLDYAGSGVVHTVGGVAGFIAATFIGPRLHRFDSKYTGAFKSQDRSYVILGTFFLWFGWYGFNAGSTRSLVGYSSVAAHASVVTTVSAAFGGLTALFWGRIIDKHWDFVKTCSGVLAGLVSISGGCAYVPSWAAAIIGLSPFIGLIVIKYHFRSLLHSVPNFQSLPEVAYLNRNHWRHHLLLALLSHPREAPR